MRRARLLGAAATAGGGCLWAASGDYVEGTRRALTLYWIFTPIVVHYRWLERRERFGFAPPTAQEWQALHQRYAEQALAGVLRLRGFYVKVGQVLALRPDVMPREYTERLHTLEDAVPPLPAEVARRVAAQGLGVADLGEVFSEWDDDCLGCASIGEAHRARLRDCGREVCVKVMHPGAESLFRADIATSKRFCQIFAPEHAVLFTEIERQFLTEFDYRGEAENLRQLRANMRPLRHLVEVPAPVPELCRREVLVMDFLRGPKLSDAVREHLAAAAARLGITPDEAGRRLREAAASGALPAVAAAGAWSRLVARLRGERAPPDPGRIVDAVLRAHAKQMLVDGCFNADPHAGNFLLLEDGRVGLIDFGQVKRLTGGERLELCEAYRYLRTGDKSGLAAAARRRGYASLKGDDEVLWQMTRFGLDSDGPAVTGEQDAREFFDTQYARDPWSEWDPLMIMPMRMCFMIRGVALVLGRPVSLLEHFGPVAEAELAAAGM
eukprot:TRINITY_DN13993_c0_g1_i1.p1 TRINITY_DN13993_c0_g1~~TRINITY_DN13993_c0_g1_i1.p1  ORF type:complete len:524 (+),score=130.58 TRINITY_DN13993_c0_g1_i1:87-1574(+)